MNQALKEGKASALHLQRLFVSSDIYCDPQTLILASVNVIGISKAIVPGQNYIDSCALGCLKALDIIENFIKIGQLYHDEKEDIWLETLCIALLSIPKDESKFVEEMQPMLHNDKVLLSECGL